MENTKREERLQELLPLLKEFYHIERGLVSQNWSIWEGEIEAVGDSHGDESSIFHKLCQLNNEDVIQARFTDAEFEFRRVTITDVNLELFKIIDHKHWDIKSKIEAAKKAYKGVNPMEPKQPPRVVL